MSIWRQPRPVWAVAFACVIAFMGIGLVDPILKPIADELGASPSQVSLLFTSYMAVMGVAMLLTGWVSSRVGAKVTLLGGLVVIIVGSALAGLQDSVAGIVAFRAVWGLGNAMFIATALAAIVSSARGSVAQAIILYEAALGVGIATGPLIGGALGAVSWRAPFLGVAVLMAVALLATSVLLPATGRPRHRTSLAAPLRALRHGPLLLVALTALLYNVGFFTLLAFTPFPLDLGAHAIGLIFFGWGVLLAISSVWVAPSLQARLGTVPSLLGALTGFGLVLLTMAALTDRRPVLAGGVVVAGFFLGIVNTLVTETVMKAAPVERGTAAAAYSFVRFSGGAVAPWLAGVLGERVSVHAPFWMGGAAVFAAVVLLASGRRLLRHLDAPEHEDGITLAEAVTVGDS
ncbi:MAG: MFS transporter [Nocardioidaceae bacterium]